MSPKSAPLPTAGIAGQKVAVFPLRLLSTDITLGWADSVGDREEALKVADSLVAKALGERSPEVEWVLPSSLRRSAARAPTMLSDPDHMATALLRHPGMTTVPDPLRSQMRSLVAVAGDRFALVPASLYFSRADSGAGQAVLTLVITDVRTGKIAWRTEARGEGDGPWTALWAALKTLTPGIP